MKNLTIIFAICIACLACEKKDDGTGYKLVSHFTFDSTFTDKNHFSHDVQIVANAGAGSIYDFNVNGKIGSCINLLGNGHIHCEKNLFANYASEYEKAKEYTVSFWMKINDISGTGLLNILETHSSFNIGTTTLDLGISLKNDSLLIKHYDYSVVGNPLTENIVDINTNDWNNIIAIFNSKAYVILINGVEVYYARRDITNNQFLNTLYIGNDENINAGLYMYADELMVYNYALTPTEATNYYNSTK
ncbi:MAG TPA: hypothetical protein PK431_11735 [Chitinophagales bacterium]|nr:hypothetical protein [Chitinophagales bacterium]